MVKKRLIEILKHSVFLYRKEINLLKKGYNSHFTIFSTSTINIQL